MLEYTILKKAMMHFLCEDCIKTRLQPSIISINFPGVIPSDPWASLKTFKRGGEGKGTGCGARGSQFVWPRAPKYVPRQIPVDIPLWPVEGEESMANGLCQECGRCGFFGSDLT
jgi:hypothetical protein